MFVVGHVLLWHQQTPGWVFEGEGGKKLDRGTALARLKSHIQAVVGRYKGRIGGWDVVNEALDEDGTLRRTPWLEAIGEDYVAKAFEFAREADPAAELYYNDYNLWKPAKLHAAIRLVQGLKAKGLRVDGLGEQAHWGIDDPPLAAIDESLAAMRAAGHPAARSPSWTWTSCPATPTCGERTSRRRRRSARRRTSTRTASRRPCRRSWRAATRTCSRSS